jgi:hypothetical protein
VSRRFRDGKPAPFGGGKGGDGDTLKSCFLAIKEFDEKAPVAITGMAATNERLCIADASGKIRTFDPNTMVKTDEFDAPGARQLTFAPDGALWVIKGGGATAPAKITHYSARGQLLPQTISGIAVPTALACDAKARLFITDDGPDQLVRIFDTATGRQIATFGVKGGIFSGVKGKVGPQRFNGLVGVGSDGVGNFYVACKGRPDGNGSGLVLQSYQPGGALNWELLGLEFVDNADVDPAADTNVYTKEEHFVMDYRKRRGQEWSYRGYALDRFAYPNDPGCTWISAARS